MRVLVLAVRVSKTLEFQSFFQRVQSAWNSSSFILVLESPWLLIEEHFQTPKTIWQKPVWRQQNKIGIEAMKVCRSHKRIFIKIAALIWKRCPWISVKPVMWKGLDFYGKKCTSPVLHFSTFISPQLYPIACYRKWNKFFGRETCLAHNSHKRQLVTANRMVSLCNSYPSSFPRCASVKSCLMGSHVLSDHKMKRILDVFIPTSWQMSP